MNYLSQSLKIAQKVAINIASEASYVYILNGQKLIKNAKHLNATFLGNLLENETFLVIFQHRVPPS